MTHGPSLSHPSQPLVTSRDSYLRVYFAQISPFDFWAEMEAMKEPERLSPINFWLCEISERNLPTSCAQFWLRATDIATYRDIATLSDDYGGHRS